jgi:hypothetical protein
MAEPGRVTGLEGEPSVALGDPLLLASRDRPGRVGALARLLALVLLLLPLLLARLIRRRTALPRARAESPEAAPGRERAPRPEERRLA